MKTKMNSCSRNLIISLSVAIAIAIVCCVLFSIAPGDNYTKDYNIYSDVEDITATYSLMDYCHENNISYSINNNYFALEGYDITFSMNKNDCSVNNNKHMNYFYLLENGRHDEVKTTKVANGATTKTFVIKTWGANYEMSNGSYVVYNMWPAIIVLAVAIVLVIVLVMYLCFCWKCKHCKHC